METVTVNCSVKRCEGGDGLLSAALKRGVKVEMDYCQLLCKEV